jgi:hypothetical protein
MEHRCLGTGLEEEILGMIIKVCIHEFAKVGGAVMGLVHEESVGKGKVAKWGTKEAKALGNLMLVECSGDVSR